MKNNSNFNQFRVSKLMRKYVKFESGLPSVKRLKICNRYNRDNSHNLKMHFTKGNPFSNFPALPKSTSLDAESDQKKGFQFL